MGDASQTTPQRTPQAEKASLKAYLSDIEKQLGRKLKQSDLAADPELSQKYKRFCELKKTPTPR